MVIKINDGIRTWNVKVEKEFPGNAGLTYVGTYPSTDIWDEHEYKGYRRNRDGVLVAYVRGVTNG